MLKEEITEFLGRATSARRSASDRDPGYPNGYDRPRRLTLNSGTIQVGRSRVRDTDERFKSRVLQIEIVHSSSRN